jgi:methionyl-tRNA synthetase
MKKFYITTAIDYVNGSPHLGHAYEKVLADVIARTRRLLGDDVYFLTGVDEHGQKVQQSARARGIPPQQFCDEVSEEFRALCAKLEISNNDFIRTTEPRHKQVVRDVLQKLFDKGEIYRAEYQGFYSTRQEQFLQDKDRNPDGSWPEIYGEVTEITESNYFFKLRAYQDWLIGFLKENEHFVFPRHRQQQVIEFLAEPLNDLCISRPKERLEWGIPLPFDEGYVTYVWFDALVNYYSAVVEKNRWPADLHVIGKDILVPPHAVYWPIMLKALGLEPPRQLLAHGWWSINGKKMSKSTGNFVEPATFADKYGVDALRYFMIREMSVGSDSDFSEAQFLARYNAELANNLGNLVNRVLNMTNRFSGGVVPAPDPELVEVFEKDETMLKFSWQIRVKQVVDKYLKFEFHSALQGLFEQFTTTNNFIEKVAPWTLGKSAAAADQAMLRTVLFYMAESLRLGALLLKPVMPSSAEKILAALGCKHGVTWDVGRDENHRSELDWGSRLTGSKVAESLILFPRPQTEKPKSG